jgi:hypothetical protein
MQKSTSQKLLIDPCTENNGRKMIPRKMWHLTITAVVWCEYPEFPTWKGLFPPECWQFGSSGDIINSKTVWSNPWPRDTLRSIKGRLFLWCLLQYMFVLSKAWQLLFNSSHFSTNTLGTRLCISPDVNLIEIRLQKKNGDTDRKYLQKSNHNKDGDTDRKYLQKSNHNKFPWCGWNFILLSPFLVFLHTAYR